MNLAKSTYYYKDREKPLSLQRQEADLRDRIERIACEFSRYGYRRITAQLGREGFIINHKRVLRIMRESSLLCHIKKKWKRTTNSNHSYPRYPNLVKDLEITNINQVWYADITYIRLLTDFVYLSILLDGYSRKIVGYSISKALDTELVLSALQMAIDNRRPLPGCIHHSDQGIQYASLEYVKELNKNNFKISMASKGNPYENAYAESFIKTLKHEEVNLWDYRTIEDVAERVPFFIQEVYNKKRLHSALGYLPPDEFESEIIKNKKICNQQNLALCQTITI